MPSKMANRGSASTFFSYPAITVSHTPSCTLWCSCPSVKCQITAAAYTTLETHLVKSWCFSSTGDARSSSPHHLFLLWVLWKWPSLQCRCSECTITLNVPICKHQVVHSKHFVLDAECNREWQHATVLTQATQVQQCGLNLLTKHSIEVVLPSEREQFL